MNDKIDAAIACLGTLSVLGWACLIVAGLGALLDRVHRYRRPS